MKDSVGTRKVASIVVSLCVLIGTGMMLCACNTTAGAGQDVSAVGTAVTGSAEKVKTGL
jgi:predicted small secreted protein